MGRGGKRKGAGRPEGSLSQKTIDKKLAEEQFTERVIKSVDRLFNAQINLAEGASYLYKIVETGEGAKKRREHVLVTDPEEIKLFLDEHEGISGVVDEEYYYITTKSPDNKAIDSLMDRAFGKAIMKTELSNPDGIPFQIIIKQKDG